MEQFKNKQHRDTTAKNYYGIWKNFNRFLIRLDDRPKDWEDRVSAYAAYLIERGIQSSTLRSYVSAIKNTLFLDGYEWSDDKLQLSVLTKACRYSNDEFRNRLPIQIGLLELLIFEVERYFTTRNQLYLEVLYRSIFLTLYYGLFRIGEVTTGDHPIQARDVHFASQKKKLLFILRTSKTHGRESKHQEVEIAGNVNLDQRNRIHYCPYLAISQYLHARGDYTKLTDPLYIFSDGSPVTPMHVRRVLKLMLKSANLNCKLYDTHSFRMGRARDLFRAGYSVEHIKKFGRWRSNAVYKYLQF